MILERKTSEYCPRLQFTLAIFSSAMLSVIVIQCSSNNYDLEVARACELQPFYTFLCNQSDRESFNLIGFPVDSVMQTTFVVMQISGKQYTRH